MLEIMSDPVHNSMVNKTPPASTRGATTPVWRWLLLHPIRAGYGRSKEAPVLAKDVLKERLPHTLTSYCLAGAKATYGYG